MSSGKPFLHAGLIDDMETIGDRVRKLREEQGLTRQELADAVGMAKTTLATLEDNRQRNTTKLHRLAEVFRVDPKWLETGRGDSRVRDVGHAPEAPEPSYPQRRDAVMIAEAEKWVRFEESAGQVFSNIERAERLLAIYQQILDDGGSLTPAHTEALIDAARQRHNLGEVDNGSSRPVRGKTAR